MRHEWWFWARPKQQAPPGDWRTWVLRAGRGFGKTRAGSGWVHQRAQAEDGRNMAIVAKTPADARDYCIEGPGGLLKNAPWWCMAEPGEWPNYEPSKRRVTWPNGSTATIYSSEEPDQLRGFSGDTAWLDEFAKWTNPRECWDNLMYGMREASSDRPRICITTTPRPLQVLRDIEGKDSTRVVTGSSYENTALDPTWFDEILSDYEGTRLGRQEIHAEIIDEFPGALWSRSMFEDHRVPAGEVGPQHMTRIVIGVDPAATKSEQSSETGIVVVGVDRSDPTHGYVLDDRTGRYSPNEWAREVHATYQRWEADAIVAEVNNGGDMVESNIRTVADWLPVVQVRATRGKQIRAQPVAGLYEQGRVHHVGMHAELEDQCCNWDPETSDTSPDRMDALVWAITELMLGAGRATEHIDDPRGILGAF